MRSSREGTRLARRRGCLGGGALGCETFRLWIHDGFIATGESELGGKESITVLLEARKGGDENGGHNRRTCCVYMAARGR